jgi:hypothetical protein
MSDDTEMSQGEDLKATAVAIFLENFPFGLGIIILAIFEGFTDLFSKEPPFTSMGLNNPKPIDNEKKDMQ